MDDFLVSKIEPKFLQNREPYILIYQLKSSNQDLKSRHNISSQKKLLKEKQVKLDDKDLSLIPNYWYEKFMTLKNPGKINYGYFACPHHAIKPDFYDCFPFLEFKNCKDYLEFYRTLICLASNEDNLEQPYDIQMNRFMCQTRLSLQRLTFESITLPKAIVDYLFELYGGKPLLKTMNICQICLLYSQNIRERKVLEIHLIKKYENSNNSGFAIIEMEWYKNWQRYLYNKQKFSARNFTKGYPIPGKINNSCLFLDAEEEFPMHDLKKDKDYVIVNSYIWLILQKIYEGGIYFI